MNWVLLTSLINSALVLAKPANDWNQPCFHGECAYDLPTSSGQSGVLQLFGSAITDITPAAGWVILDCDPHALEQEIRLVCANHDLEASGCQHVFNDGPLHKVVRLPESCSAGPFLRVASASIAEDQSIPHHATSKVSKRDGVPPTVHIFRVDTNWAAADVSQTGTVDFVFTGATASGTGVHTPSDSIRPRSTSFDTPEWLKSPIAGVKSAVSSVSDAYDHAKATVTNFVDGLHPGAVFNDAKTSVTDVVDKLHQGTTFSVHPDVNEDVHFKTSEDVVVYQNTQLLKPGCSENSLTPSVVIAAGGEMSATAKIDLKATGSLIPPQVSNYVVHGVIDADVDAHIRVNATVNVHLETERKRLGHIDLSPLEIPGIISLGPAVELEAQANLDLSLAVSIDTHVDYKVKQLEFWHPKQLDKTSHAKSVHLSPASFSVSAAANVAAEAAVTGHLIPSLRLGLFIGGSKVAQASAFVEADVWLKARLRGEASTSVGRRTLHSTGPSPAARYSPPYLNTRNIEAHDGDVAFKGCLDFSAGVAFREAEVASIFGYQAGTKPFIIYESPALSIYERCWAGAFRMRSLIPASFLPGIESIKSLKCSQQSLKSVGSGQTGGGTL